MESIDLLVVGAGIVGLAHALAAARRGLRVVVVERDHRCVGASIRNFGFVTVTGQRDGATRRRALRSRDVWAEVAPQAGIPVLQRGLHVLARRASALRVIEAFARAPMGRECRLLAPDEIPAPVRKEGLAGALYSPHELRVESRTAIPRLAAWLAEAHHVRFVWGEAVLHVAPGEVRTARRALSAARVVLCPGTDLAGVARGWLPDGLRLTQLQMLRVRPSAGRALPTPILSDLSLVRYPGFAELPEAAALANELRASAGACLDLGIHLIAVQSADGTLVVGDSHVDATTPEPFASEAIDRLLLAQLQATLDLGTIEVVERWSGVYPVGHSEDALVVAPAPALRVVLVTSGTGASTAFGLAEEVLAAW